MTHAYQCFKGTEYIYFQAGCFSKMLASSYQTKRYHNTDRT